jgi:hypothetical protein
MFRMNISKAKISGHRFDSNTVLIILYCYLSDV